MVVERVRNFIHEHEIMDDRCRVLVALSGGSDSVALLRILMQLGYECLCAHCNFHLRGDESDRDEHFVTRLCETLNVPLVIKHFDVGGYQDATGASVEMACRELRYEWFSQLLEEHDCRCVAVGHHIDDNIETFFLNALRGTGIAGLAGMKPRNGNVVRPLLCLSRHEILSWLSGVGQDYVTDSTNDENEVKRNRLRNIVLPAIYGNFPGSEQSLNKTIENVMSCFDLYNEAVGVMRNIVSEKDENGVVVIERDILDSFACRSLLLYEILKPLGFNASQCSQMLSSVVGRHFTSSSHKALIDRDKILVSPHREIEDEVHTIDLTEAMITSPITIEVKHLKGGQFSPSMVDGKSKIALNAAVLNASEVVLRRWREGDRIKPFGMRGSKLVSDLFTDNKLNELAKQQAWLLEADGEILWVVGYRASRNYAVPPAGSDFLLLSLL